MECKVVRIILLIVFVYVLCWVFYLIIIISYLRENFFMFEVNFFVICFVFCMGIVNFIIYVFMNRVICYEINKFFCDIINKGNGCIIIGNDSDEFYFMIMIIFFLIK